MIFRHRCLGVRLGRRDRVDEHDGVCARRSIADLSIADFDDSNRSVVNTSSDVCGYESRVDPVNRRLQMSQFRQRHNLVVLSSVGVRCDEHTLPVDPPRAGFRPIEAFERSDDVPHVKRPAT